MTSHVLMNGEWRLQQQSKIYSPERLWEAAEDWDNLESVSAALVDPGLYLTLD